MPILEKKFLNLAYCLHTYFLRLTSQQRNSVLVCYRFFFWNYYSRNLKKITIPTDLFNSIAYSIYRIYNSTTVFHQSSSKTPVLCGSQFYKLNLHFTNHVFWSQTISPISPLRRSLHFFKVWHPRFLVLGTPPKYSQSFFCHDTFKMGVKLTFLNCIKNLWKVHITLWAVGEYLHIQLEASF